MEHGINAKRTVNPCESLQIWRCQTANQSLQQCRWFVVALYPLRDQQNEFC